MKSFVILSFCLCESHDVYFLYYFSSLYVFIFVHLSALLSTSCRSGISCKVELKITKCLQKLGVLRTFVALVFFVVSCFFFFINVPFILYFFKENPLPGLNTLNVD